MKVKELIYTLGNLDRNKQLIFYLLENYDLEHLEIETTLDVDDRIELTFKREGNE